MVQTHDELLTVKEAAAILKVTPHTIYRWVGEGRLPAVRHSRRVLRLRRSDVETQVTVDHTQPGEPRKGSPQAILKMVGIFPDPEFHRVMEEVIKERTMTNFDSPFDELSD